MEKEYLYTLINKILDGSANDAEKAQINDWYYKNINEETEWVSDSLNEEELVYSRMLTNIQEHIRNSEK